MSKKSDQKALELHFLRTDIPSSQHKSTFGIRLLLIGILLAMGVWVLTRVPPGLLIIVSISILLVIFLFLAFWFARRYRPTPEELDWQAEQRAEHMQMQVTAQAIGIRPIEREDLAFLNDREFEEFSGALLEAMGVATELIRVGGAKDRGIDLRGKNRHGQLLIVQYKRYFSGNIPPNQTREFGGTIGLHRAQEAWFVTTAFFSNQARADVEYLVHNGHMFLVDGKNLQDFTRDYWSVLPPKWQWRLTECMVKRDRQRHAE